MKKDSNNVTPKKNDLSSVSNKKNTSTTSKTTNVKYNTSNKPKPKTVSLNSVVANSKSSRTANKNKKVKIGMPEDQKSLITKATLSRLSQDNVMSGNVKSKIVKNVALEAKASYYEALAKYKDKRVTLTPSMKDNIEAVGKDGVNAVKSFLSAQDDVGSQIISGGITALETTGKVLKAADKTMTATVKTVMNMPNTIRNAKDKIVKVGNKAYQIYGTADKIYLTVKQSLPLLKGGFVPVKNGLVANALKNGLHKTKNIKRIIELSKKIKNTYNKTKKVVQGTTRAVKYGIKVIKTIAIDRKLKGNISKTVLKQAKNKAKPYLKKAKSQGLKALNSAGKKAARTAVKGGVFAVKRGIPQGLKGAGKAISDVGGVLSSSDNEMLKGVGHSITIGKYTVKTMANATKYTARFVKTAPTKINNGVAKVKTATKKTVSTTTKAAKTVGKATSAVGKTTYKGFQYARQKGLKQAFKKAASKAKSGAAKASANAGKSIVNVLINVAKKALGKLAIPLIIAGAVMGLLGGAAGAGGAVVGYYTSGEFFVEGIKKVGEALGNVWDGIVGFFSGDDDEETEPIVTDIEEYLLTNVNGIGHHRELYIQKLSEELSASLRENGGQYDKLTLILDNGTQINMTETSEIEGVLNDNFWESEELYEKIRPLFYVRVLVEYDLNTTVAQADTILEEVFDSIISHGGFEGQADDCGIICPCGIIHADVDCPHSVDIIHTEYTCDKCCVSECVGHVTKIKVCLSSLNPVLRHTCDSECVLTEISQTTYCEDKSCGFSCSGIKKCESHYSWCVALAMERNIERFIDEYIDKPIADLEAKGSERTPEENSRLATLKDYKDIAEEFIK